MRTVEDVSTRWPSLFAMLLLVGCSGGSTTSTTPPSTGPPSTVATSLVTISTTPATTTTIDPLIPATVDCYIAAVDDFVVSYVDNLVLQQPVPVGIADRVYAVSTTCVGLTEQLRSSGRLEASAPVETLAAIADSYAECLNAPEYQCALLRVQYIAAVSAIGHCDSAPSIFNRS